MIKSDKQIKYIVLKVNIWYNIRYTNKIIKSDMIISTTKELNKLQGDPKKTELELFCFILVEVIKKFMGSGFFGGLLCMIMTEVYK